MKQISFKNLKNLKILNEIREIYFQNTGMVISFHYFDDKNSVDFYPTNYKNEFCRLIQSTKEGFIKCLESDRYGLSLARKKGTYSIYKCHAGLYDVAIPLVYKNNLIGSIYTGQVLLENPSDEVFDKIYRKLKGLNIDYNSLRDAFFKIKIVKKDKLIFFVRLLSLIANYIISIENELYLQKEINYKNKELNKKESEKIKLERELKDLSIAILEYEKNNKIKMRRIAENDIKNNHIITKAQLFIKSNYDKHIRLEDVAKAVYLSPSYFSMIFKKLTGYNFSQYLVRTRIEMAKKLLRETDLPIKEIVYKTGFEDYNYFNRTFKKFENTPPARFRNLQKQLLS